MKTVIIIILAAFILYPVLEFIVQWSMKLYIIIKGLRNEKFAEYVMKELNIGEENETEK